MQDTLATSKRPRERGLLVLSAVSEKRYEDLDLVLVDVLLEKLAVVVHQGCNGVLGQNTVPNLTLHCPKKLVRYLFLHVYTWNNVCKCMYNVYVYMYMYMYMY